jgi:hypothetical protein
MKIRTSTAEQFKLSRQEETFQPVRSLICGTTDLSSYFDPSPPTYQTLMQDTGLMRQFCPEAGQTKEVRP